MDLESKEQSCQVFFVVPVVGSILWQTDLPMETVCTACSVQVEHGAVTSKTMPIKE